MGRVTRFGVSLPVNVVEKFDERIAELGYDSRSKAILDAIGEFITQTSWKGDEGVFVGTISYAYDHRVGDVTHRLTQIQHGHDKTIRSTMHSHISHDVCVEVMIVEGKASEIKRLCGSIASVRGVENCKAAALLKK